MPSVPGQRKAGKHNNLPAKLTGTERIPATLSDSPAKCDLWVFMVEDLKSRGLWSSTFTIALESLVQRASRLREITETLDEEGLQVERYSAKGDPIGWQKHPLLSEENNVRTSLGNDLKKFGMTPLDIVFLLQTDPEPDEVLNNILNDGKTSTIIYFR